MALNLLVGGAAGQGIDTTAAILEHLLKKAGYFVFSTRDFMSRIRGGHNFILIRFGEKEITSHSMVVDGLIAMNEETIELHQDQLSEQGFILCDSSLRAADDRTVAINMNDIAKELGNARVAGIVAVGALMALLSLDRQHVSEVLSKHLPEKVLDINIKALDRGFSEAKPRISEPAGSWQDHMILSGTHAMALGALAADVRFYSAYPMSPSTGIMEYLAGRGKDCDVVVEQAEDEIAAMNMALGASFAGVRAMTGTSGGGFCLMVEALGLAGLAEIPIVVCDAQRPGPATGLPTRTEQSDLKFVISAAQGEFPRMVIAVRDHTDAYLQTIRAFHLAERYRIPVILLSDQYLADAFATVPPFPLREEDAAREPNDSQDWKPTDGEEIYRSYALTESGVTRRLYPGHPEALVAVDSDEHDEDGQITESADVRTDMMDKRMRKLDQLQQELQEPIRIGEAECDTLLLGWGSMKGPLTEAVHELNSRTEDNVSALVFGDVFPLPVKRLQEMAGKATRIINVEQNATGQLAGLIREYTGISCTDHILKYDGRQLSGHEIVGRLWEVIG